MKKIRPFVNRRIQTLFSLMMILLVSVFFTSSLIAQTFPAPSRCTSEDLQVLGATLTGGDVCNTCTPGTQITRTLTLSIHNTTGSDRTGFAFWGTLKIYDGNTGALKTTTLISGCEDEGVTPGTAALPAETITDLVFSDISYTCGDILRITDIYAAWTAANDNAGCPLLSEDIAPKCDTIFSLQVNAGVNGEFILTHNTCFGANAGAIDLTPTGGTGEYTYAWSASNGGAVPTGQEDSEDLTGLLAGTYTVIITDINNCTTTKERTITGPAAGLTLGTCSKTDVNCSGLGGSVTAGAVTNAVGTVHYSWKNSLNEEVGTAAVVNNNLPADTYTLTITDDCSSKTCSVTVAAPPPLTTPAASVIQPDCITTSGTVNITSPVNGVTYTLTQSGNVIYTAVSGIFSSVAPGTYGLSATNGICSATGDNVIVNPVPQPPTAEAGTGFTKTCIANPNGAAIGEAPVAGFSYAWLPTAGLSDDDIANPTANPSSTTVYTVTKTNTTTGCFDTDEVTVTVNNTAVVAEAGTGFTKTCVANENGAQIGEAPVAGFSYAWLPTTGLSNAAIANPTANPSVTTEYTVTKTNNTTGCFDTDAVTVTVNNATVTAEAGTGFTKTCVANPNGAAIGEAPVAGFSYAWLPTTGLSNAAIANPTANPSVTTEYTVTKTNNTTGCFDTDAVTVTVNNATVTAEAGTGFTKTCVANENGAAIGEAPVAGFSYAWLPTAGLSNAAIANPTANPGTTTEYTVTKTNTTTGCFDADEVTVTVNNTAVVAEAGTGFTKTCIANPNGAQIGEAPVAGFSYAWSPSAGLSDDEIANPTANPSSTTVYTVTKTNTTTGCFDTDDVTVTVNNATVTAEAGTGFTKTCIANPNGAQIGESPVAGFSYAWSPSAGLSDDEIANPTANPSSTTVYTVTKTNTTTGCFDTDDVTVTVNNATVTAEAGTGFTKTCIANPNGAQIGEAPVAGFSYSWSPSAGLSDDEIANPTANPSSTTVYTVTKTNTTTGCYDTDDVTVTVNNATVTAEAGTGFTKTCIANPNGAQIGEAPVAGFSYSWSPSAGLSDDEIANPTANPSSTTVYTVTKTNTTTGCFDTDDVTVTVNNARPATPAATVTPPSCTVSTGTVTVTSPVGADFQYSNSGGAYQSSPVFTVAANAAYSITVRRISTGCTSLSARTGTMGAQPRTPTASITCGAQRCTGTVASFSLTAVTDGVSFVWSKSAGADGSFSSTTTSPTVYTPGANDKIKGVTITLTATSGDGCTKTATLKLNPVPCGLPVYTYTQGYYSGTGTACTPLNGAIKGAAAVIALSLDNTDGILGNSTGQLYLGKSGASFTVKYAEAAKLVAILPGGSIAGRLYANYNLGTLASYPPLNNGKIANILLSQTTTLGVNIYIPGNGLKNFILKTGYLTTITRTSSSCTAGAASCATGGKISSLRITSNSTLMNLLNNQTVDSLFRMAKKALGGTLPSGVSYSDINNAVDVINKSFDGGRFLIGYYATAQSCSSTSISVKPLYVESQEQQPEVTATLLSVTAYPNPFTDRVKFNIVSPVSGNASLDVYNMMGQKVANVYNGYLQAGRGQVIEYNATGAKGSLIYTLKVGDKQINGKVIHLK